MPEPTGTRASRPATYRPAPTQPLDPTVADKATQPLDPTVADRATQPLAAAHRAPTTPLGPEPRGPKPLPGFLGTIQDWVQGIFGGAPGNADVPTAAADRSTLSLQDGPQGVRSWGLVAMDGSEPTADPAKTTPAEGMRKWGMVAMDDADRAVQTPARPPPGMFRTWGMVSMRDPDPPPLPVPAPVPVPAAPALDPAPRAQLLAKIKGAVSPDVSVLIDQLASEGTLDLRGRGGTDILNPAGRTILENLADMTDMRLSDTAMSLGFKNATIVEQTIRDLADPLGIKQDGENDCVWTNLRFHLSKDRPGDYAQLAYVLYRDGQAQLQEGGQVRLEDALTPFDLGGKIGKVWYQDGDLWLQYKGFPPMSAEKFVREFLHNQGWIDRILERNKILDNPLIRGLVDKVRKMWDEGKRGEVLELVAPLVDLYIQMAPGKNAEGLGYALANFRSLFKPSTQAGEALPAGLALGRVDEFYPGLQGFYVDDTVLGYIDQAAARGAQVPVAFANDEASGLHMASILGKVGDDYLIYDPRNGARTMPAFVLRERAVGAFLPPEMGIALNPIPDTDTREVGGGRFTWRRVFA